MRLHELYGVWQVDSSPPYLRVGQAELELGSGDRVRGWSFVKSLMWW